MPFFLSESAVSTVAVKACRPDQCPAGMLAGDSVLIKAFADNIPPFSASSLSQFVDSVFLLVLILYYSVCPSLALWFT